MALPPGRNASATGLPPLVAGVGPRASANGRRAEPAELYQALLDETEPALLGEVLRQLDGNRLVAGRWLGLARATVRKMIRKHGLDDGSDGDEE